MNQDDTKPKLQIDSDWKAQAQAEKERLAAQEAKKKTTGEETRGRHGLPDPDFRGLISILASQALMGLGMLADRETGRPIVDLEGARFNISLLEVLEEKTKGNLAGEEEKELRQLITDLQARFVQIAQLLASQGAAPGADPAAAGPTPGVDPG